MGKFAVVWHRRVKLRRAMKSVKIVLLLAHLIIAAFITHYMLLLFLEPVHGHCHSLDFSNEFMNGHAD